MESQLPEEWGLGVPPSPRGEGVRQNAPPRKGVIEARVWGYRSHPTQARKQATERPRDRFAAGARQELEGALLVLVHQDPAVDHLEERRHPEEVHRVGGRLRPVVLPMSPGVIRTCVQCFGCRPSS